MIDLIDCFVFTNTGNVEEYIYNYLEPKFADSKKPNP